MARNREIVALFSFFGPSADLAETSVTISWFAGAYFEAALRLSRGVRNKRQVDQRRVLPMVFLFRHAAELSLKAILQAEREVAEAIGNEAPPPGASEHHRLGALLRDAIAHLPSGKELPKELIQFIEMLAEIDDSSFEFRYATDKKGKRPTNALKLLFDVSALVKAARLAAPLIETTTHDLLYMEDDNDDEERRILSVLT